MSTITFSPEELKQISEATLADIREAAEYSTVRCREFSPLDHDALKHAVEEPGQLLEHLCDNRHLIATLACAVERFCKGFELAARLRLWLRHLQQAAVQAERLAFYESQRGALS